MTSTLADNPVLAPWGGPHGGGPAFDQVRVEHFAPALDEAMARYRAEIAAIAENPEPPSFANTLEALERSGRDYRQATSLMGTFTSTMNTPAMQAVQREAAPKLAAFRDEIMHNRPLFERIRAVFEARAWPASTPTSARTSWPMKRASAWCWTARPIWPACPPT